LLLQLLTRLGNVSPLLLQVLLLLLLLVCMLLNPWCPTTCCFLPHICH
jgi:hypothetical protein